MKVQELRELLKGADKALTDKRLLWRYIRT